MYCSVREEVSDCCLVESEVYHPYIHLYTVQYRQSFDIISCASQETLHKVSAAAVQQKHQVTRESQARSEQSDPFWLPRSGVDDELEPPSKRLKASDLEGQME